MALPVKEGGIGFDYRLGMGIPDYWMSDGLQRRAPGEKGPERPGVRPAGEISVKPETGLLNNTLSIYL